MDGVENWHTLSGAVDAIEHEAMQRDVEIGGRSEALDDHFARSKMGRTRYARRGRAKARINVTALVWASVRWSPACWIRNRGNDPVDDLQDGREQPGMCSEQQAKRDRKLGFLRCLPPRR